MEQLSDKLESETRRTIGEIISFVYFVASVCALAPKHSTYYAVEALLVLVSGVLVPSREALLLSFNVDLDCLLYDRYELPTLRFNTNSDDYHRHLDPSIPPSL